MGPGKDFLEKNVTSITGCNSETKIDIVMGPKMGPKMVVTHCPPKGHLRKLEKSDFGPKCAG